MECENDVILNRAKILAKSCGKNTLRSATLVVLYDLEYPMKAQTFEYAKRTILTSYRRRSNLSVGAVFAEVGASFDGGVTSKAVEKSFGDGIKIAWAGREHAKWDLYFPQHVLRHDEAPSSQTFLVAITNFLEMVVECSEEVEYAAK